MKTALNQTELYEVVLDVEIAYNNCSLHYIEDDIQLPVLTSASPWLTSIKPATRTGTTPAKGIWSAQKNQVSAKVPIGIVVQTDNQMFVRVERTTPLETQGQTTHLAKVIIIVD